MEDELKAKNNGEEAQAREELQSDSEERVGVLNESAINSIPPWRMLFEEMKRLSSIAGPMVAVNLSAYLLQLVSSIMVGHLGKFFLSSTAIAIAFANATAFSLMVGMSGALETLSGQAYGAKQYQKLGTQTYTATFCLIIVCIPLSVLWIYMGRILVLFHQDPLISHEAGKFAKWLLPALFAYAIQEPLVRYFQMQSMTLPMLLSSAATLCLHIPLCWVLVFKSGLNNHGAALAIGISMWFNTIILGLYMRFSSTCKKTLSPFSMEIFKGIKEFMRFAIPSAVMTCLQWWIFELLILLSGLLPNPQLETSVLSVCLTIISSLFMIPYGLGAAASTRVSNELGAGKFQEAHVVVYAVMILTVATAVIVSAGLFASRNVFGYAFSKDKEVVYYVKKMAPLMCVSVIFENLQGTFQGVVRGCGWQRIGTYVNLAALYLFGIPIAAILAFYVHLRGEGLWIGIQAGVALQAILLFIITYRTDWKKQATRTRKRLFDGSEGKVQGFFHAHRKFKNINKEVDSHLLE